MLNRITHILGLLGVVLTLASCDATIHEYPTEASIVLNVSCNINPADPEFFVTVECDAKNGTSYIVRTQGMGPGDTRFDEPYKLRYTVDLYRVIASHTEFVERRTFITAPEAINETISTSFDVLAAEYKVLIWSDYVRASAENEDWYYQTDDLRKILYTDIEVKDNNDKDVFTNMESVNLREYYYQSGTYTKDIHLTLERPKGRYKCITTDINDYIGKDNTTSEITTVATYVQNVAAGYNVEEQKPNNFETTRTYISTVSTDDLDEEGNLEMCYDYLFVDSKQTNVKINFQFYKGVVKMVDGVLTREDGKEVTEDDRISNWSGIVVPLKRNMETVIEGRLLTASFGSGGIGIDPGFEGEIVIPWE